MADRNEIKALLARTGVEVNNALHRVDTMSESELHEIGQIAPVAFFDKNGSCGAATVKDLAAFFDKNGSCGAGLTQALENVLKIRGR